MKNYGFSTELRAADGAGMVLEGRAIPFNTPTVLYEAGGIKYREVIDSGALDGADLSDCVLRYNHQGTFVVLARTRNKSLRLERRADGLYFRAELQDDIQSHKDLYAAVKSSLVDRMSFAFAVADGGDSYDQATHTRTVIGIRKLFDISLVDQPAYEQTTVEARQALETLDLRDSIQKNITEVTKMEKYKNMTAAQISQTVQSLETEARSCQEISRLREINGELSKANKALSTGAYMNERTAVMNGVIPGIVTSSARGQAIDQAATAETEYRQAFYAVMTGKGTVEQRELVTTATGGAVIPETMMNQILETAQKQQGLLSYVRVLNIPGKLSIPVGEVQSAAQWHVEGAPIGDTNAPPQNNVTLGGFELAKLFSMSAAMQSMSISAFESYLVAELGRCTRDALNDAIYNGLGTTQPTGIESLSWDATNSKAVTGWEDMLEAMSLMPSNFRQGAVFVMNSECLYKNIGTLSDSNGNPLFIRDAASSIGDRLLGRQVIVDDFVGDDVAYFLNPQYYWFNFSKPIAIERSSEAGFATGTILYRSLAVVDGAPISPLAFVKMTF